MKCASLVYLINTVYYSLVYFQFVYLLFQTSLFQQIWSVGSSKQKMVWRLEVLRESVYGKIIKIDIRIHFICQFWKSILYDSKADLIAFEFLHLKHNTMQTLLIEEYWLIIL